VPARPLTGLDVSEVVATVVPRVRALLARRGLGDDDASDVDIWGDEAPALAEAAAASVQGLVTGGTGVMRPLRMVTDVPCRAGDHEGMTAPLEGCHARADGFDLHADVRIGAGQPERLERLCRYALRPPLASDRLALTPQGRVRLTLRHPYRDGTAYLVFEPRAFLARLAVLVPRPRVNLLLYHGVLAPRAAWRQAIVPGAGETVIGPGRGDDRHATEDGTLVLPGGRNYRWAELMRRTFGIEVLACPRCGGPNQQGDSTHALRLDAKVSE
jgi:hypothetical protein